MWVLVSICLWTLAPLNSVISNLAGCDVHEQLHANSFVHILFCPWCQNLSVVDDPAQLHLHRPEFTRS